MKTFTRLLFAALLVVSGLAGAQVHGNPNALGGRALAQRIPAPFIVCKTGVAVAAPADTSEDTLYTCAIPANALGANGKVRVRATYTCTSSVNNKTFNVRYSGASGTIVIGVVQTAVSRVTITFEISNRNATNSQITVATFATSSATTELAPTTSAIDTTPITTVVLTGTKASAGETLQLEAATFELLSDGT